MKTAEYVDRRTKEYQFIIKRIKEMTNPVNIKSVINLGYHPIITGLRFKDVELFHNFYNN